MINQTEEALARSRFAKINAVRLAGVGSLLIGIATLAGSLGLPVALGYVLVLIGAIGTFLVPTLLARRWSTRARSSRSES